MAQRQSSGSDPLSRRTLGSSMPLGKTGAFALSSTLPSARGAAAGPGGVAGGAGLPRDPLFSLHAEDLSAFDLPTTKAKPGARPTAGRRAVPVTAAATQSTRGVGTLSPSRPNALNPSESGTLSLVKEALGIYEESKAKELDEIVSSLNAITHRAGGSGAAATAEVGPAASAAPPHAADDSAAQALIDVLSLKTGEDVIAFFLKYGASCPVKFVYLKRRYGDNEDIFKPYELVVVPQKDAGDDYYTMSAKGVVHVAPGEPSEFLDISEWMRDTSAFNICSSMRFFKYFLPRKMFQQWRANVRFNRYCKQRYNVRNQLFSWKPAFQGAMRDIATLLNQMESKSLLDLSGSRYAVTTFTDAQTAQRTETLKFFERQVALVQEAIERVCADVVKRARATDEDGEGGDEAKEKIKSMAAAKAEAARKAAALRAAAAEEAVLGQFVRVVDYMLVETLARVVTEAFAAMQRELADVDARKGLPGMFVTAVRFDSQVGTVFEPTNSELVNMVDSVVADTVKACTALPRLLYARSFREYVQDLPAERGAGSFGAPSVAALLEMSREFEAVRNGIDSTFRRDFDAAKTYVAVFDPVRPIFEYKMNFDFVAYKANAASNIFTLQRDISRLKGWKVLVDKMRSQHVEGCLYIDSKRLKLELEPVTEQGMDRLKDLLLDSMKEKCLGVTEGFLQRSKVLDQEPATLERFATHVERLNGIKEAEAALMKDANNVEDMQKLLVSYDKKISSEDSVMLDEMAGARNIYTDSYRKSERFLEERLPEMSRQVDMNIIKITEQLTSFGEAVNQGIYLDASQPSGSVIKQLDAVRAEVASREELIAKYNKWQQLFATTPTEVRQLKATAKLLDTRYSLWKGLYDFETNYATWTDGPFSAVDVEELARSVQASLKLSYTLDKQLGDDVTALFKQKVSDFKVFVPVITDLGNKAIRDRHWKRIYETCGQVFVPNRTDRTLGEMMAFNIFDQGELVSEVSGTASGEAQLEASLAKIVEAWEKTDFIVKSYREQRNVYILGSLEEIMLQLEDHQVTLQTMMGSRFIMGVRSAVEAWDKRLGLLSDTLDEWLMCQKQWMYLETIFSAEDIQRQLPDEAAKFTAVDKKWKEIMLRTFNRPNVISAVEHGDDLLKTFQRNNELLEQIQKSLEDYLETKRAGFPRFYFLSNDELLAILSQTRDPTAVQPHLMKCFDNIKSLDFSGPVDMVGMNSGENEKVSFSSAVTAAGNVEQWLTNVEAMMRKSLYDHSKAVLHKYPPFEQAIDRAAWYFCGPAQCIIVVDQIMWTQGCTEAIKAIASGQDKDRLQKFYDYSRKQIDNMVALVRGNLTKLQRTLLGAMVVIDVHARDVVAAMVKKKVSSLEDFEWTKQLRYYWEMDVDNCVVRQTNTRFLYGYEYLGNNDRLVITPLTDQCYMTLTGALHLKFGGAPAGPAGTGKTETTKDLAKALANQCVVFNCSDGLDYMIMGRFFSGLAQAGAWACFDEFNRIDIEVLSVIAQQVLVIQQGLVSRSPFILFEGREIPLNPSFGVFITMNPGYAGRAELPDNLKSLFRPVAMMVPDYRLIAEIVLFSQGFTDALILSNKMVQLYRLSSEQLSKQDHYDFGMRAVKSVLVAAGQLKRKEPDVDENILLIRAMRDSNVPKFLEHDLPLFRGILADLFPGIVVPFVDYGKLQQAIENQLDIAGLQKVPTLITKIIQTHETQLVRHGMMLVGETGSGKTTNHVILANALAQLKREGVTDKDGFFQKVNEAVLNPKSITMGDLYGEFNLATQEWRDGLVAFLVREAVVDNTGNRNWIIFDGPVDAIWIENMNTVLDDNKMLCLSNGERIKLAPSMHMMFEVRDLAVASPATVSRCGMVYMEPLHVGVTALMETWATGEIEDLLPEHTPQLLQSVLGHVPKILKFLRSSCQEIIPSQDSNLVTSFLNLLLTLLRPENGVKGPNGTPYPRSAAEKARERFIKLHGASAVGDDHHHHQEEEGKAAEGKAEEGKTGEAAPAAVPAPAPAEAAPAPAEADVDLDMGDGGRKAAKGAMAPEHLAKVVDLAYVFAVMWSFGCNLHDNSRAKFNAFVHELLGDKVPAHLRASDGVPATDLYSLYVEPETASLQDWSKRMLPFKYVPDTPYFSLLVPTADTTRYAYLFETLMHSGRNVLFSGDTGVGKSVIVADALFRMCTGDEAKFVAANVNFSAQTTSSNLQEALEANLDKKRKNLLGPPSGKRMCVFVDDMNMPAKEKYGAQPPIELLRQVIDQGGFYDRQKLFFKQVANCVFAAACAPPGGGRQDVTTRLMRHFHMVWLPSLSDASMTLIFDSILGGFLGCEAPGVAPLASEIVKSSVAIYQRVQLELLPTPSKSHYTFNLRDLSKVFQGMLMVKAPQLQENDSLLRLWVHELQRVFRDRLINQEDRDWFNAACGDMLAKRLGTTWPVSQFENILYGDYLVKGDAEKKYVYVPDASKLSALFGEYQEEYNVTFPSAMYLVYFRDAVAHVSRIARILRQPRGNALLVGVGGSGRRSLTRLASFMAEFPCNSIEITRGYGVNEWHDDLKKVMMKAGIKGQDVTFLFSDTQIVKESFLEDINNILNSGDVPNLYAPDEMEQIMNGCRAAVKAAGKVETRSNIFTHYVQQVREHFHIVLCMSPIGAAFRNRCRQFPALVNCCTIDWFNAWPDDALYSVAKVFLGGDASLSLGPLVDPLCSMCVKIHQSVEEASKRFLTQQRRYNYTTPTSYLELLRLYVGMLNTQRGVVNKKIERYRVGLTKLAETNEMVAGLQVQLKELQPVLAKAQEDTAALLVQLEKDQADADVAASIAAKDEAETAEVARNVAVIKEDCAKDLDEALPAYYQAVKALKSLDKKQIQEVKSFANPPRLVGYVLEAVCILLGQKETWDDAKKLMNQANFMEQLQNYDKDNIDPKIIKKVTKYVKDPEFHPDVVSKVSMAATSLCLWVRAIYKYDEVARTIAPKKAKLAEAEAKLDAAQATLQAKRDALNKVLARLAELKATFTASLNKRDELNANSVSTGLRLERANKLTGGLGAEAVRWSAAAGQLETDLNNLVGNMILSSGCVAYIGAFTAGYRSDLINEWVRTCNGLDIPVDANFNLTRLLADPVQVRQWNIMGLPADEFSTANGLFATTGRRWPLMIDPQGQANRWIKAMHKEDKLQVIKLSQSDFLRTLENAIRFGQPVLLENVEETLDPALEPVLLKQTFKKGGQILLRLGDTDVPYSDEFRFYITTKLANPHYMPEVCIKVTVINFTVTLRGLEDQLLVDVVRYERPDLEQKKDQLIVSIAADKKALKDIEDKILQMLAESKGDILEDEALINSLAQSKVTSNAISERMVEAETTTREITEARELYRPVATRGSILYFVIAGMANVDSMYQYSLPAFSRLYNMRIEKSEKSDVLQDRINILIDDLTRSFFANVCRGLFEVHKLLYSFLIGVDVMKAAGAISAEEWSLFLVGNTLKDAGAHPQPEATKEWMSSKQWLSALALEALPHLKGIAADVAANAGGAWKAWMSSKTASTDVLPGRWSHIVGGTETSAPDDKPAPGSTISSFQRLLITRLLREEKTVTAVREFVRMQLGAFYCEPPPFDLESTYEDSTAQTPLIFILSSGADPIDYLLKLAKSKGKAGPGFKIISLGQGQGPVAEAMMDAARRSGDWVCLQNCHLAVSWLPRLEALLESTTGTGEHPEYRLWLTSMPSPQFPVAVLQNGIKLTQEPPRGIKANLMRTYLDLSDKEYDACTKSFEFKKLMFGLAFYHALVLERRKFGAVGWNIPYDFMNSDLKTGTAQLRMYLDEQPGVPYETLNNVVADITYGGRVTDKWDKRTNISLLRRYFCPEIMQDGFKFSDSGLYFAPDAPTTADVRKYIETLPLDETPDTFGLHENAAITLQLKETGDLVSTLVSMQPRSGGGGGGKSGDDIVMEILEDVEKRLPPPMNKEQGHPTTFAKIADGSVNSLGVFVEQEMVRFNILTKVMKSTLAQLKKAVKGLVVMSASLEAMYSAFLFQKVPAEWEAAAYPSLMPLAGWIEDLFKRLEFINDWLLNGPPISFWICGFFFPQGFMTGALQMHARKTQVAIDALDFFTHVMPFDEDHVPGAPENGVYVYGIFVEGARWNFQTAMLDEMLPGQLTSRLPCLWFEPILAKSLDPGTCYYCPFYKTSRRAGTLSTTGHSTNYVTLIYLPTNKSQDHWVRRGLAALSMPD